MNIELKFKKRRKKKKKKREEKYNKINKKRFITRTINNE